MEFEGQIRQLQQMLQQQKEAEEELVARIGKLQEEKRELQDRLANFQRGLSNAEQEKRELERAHVRLEKDKKALRNTLDKVRMDPAGPEIKIETLCTSLIHFISVTWRESLNEQLRLIMLPFFFVTFTDRA